MYWAECWTLVVDEMNRTECWILVVEEKSVVEESRPCASGPVALVAVVGAVSCPCMASDE